MPYATPTPADIKADFPAFANADDAVIQRRIDRTASSVDESWSEADYAYARSLLTAHYLVLDGIGQGTDAELAGLGLSGVSRLKSGSLDVSFSDTTSGVQLGGYDSTSYGRRFLALLRRNRGGPLITGNGCVGIADAATDVPWAWRTAGWGL